MKRKRESDDETIRKLEKKATAGDIDSLWRLLEWSKRLDSKELSHKVDDIAWELFNKLREDISYKDYKNRFDELREIGLQAWEHRNKAKRYSAKGPWWPWP